ncbi:uncharacterized protein LOC128237525 [Mya arenaria]|uniref:uncharacterized protein LOC128237525 n=1 Tax=Mya arenaria TaxID=6604 RepID=UPI0022E9408A|nr:uncharacterized protein LOC128237525 [Mya arenaria]
MWEVVLAVMLMSIGTPGHAQSASQDMFNVKTMPDPVTRYQACGRSGPSFVCDPNNLLQESQANRLDELLKDIYNETTIPCYASGPRASRRRGYLVMVAIVNKMKRLHTVNITDYSQQVRYMEAQYFSYYLGNELKWGRHSSQCNEMVIIFYSNEDQVLYTSTQPQARKLLTDDIVRTAVLETISADYPYTEPGQLASALMRLVRTYGTVLREEVAPQ